MKAVQIISPIHYGDDRIVVIHDNVVEITEKDSKYKEYKCNCCGQTWKQTITSPQIIETDVEKELDKYYPNHKHCKI